MGRTVTRARGCVKLRGLLTALVVLTGCGTPEDVVPGRPLPGSPREAYVYALEDAGLARTALAMDWRRAGEMALAEAVPVSPPYREARYLAADEPSALSYGFSARRGQRLQVAVRPEAERPHRLFIELFRVSQDTLVPPIPVATAEEGVWALEEDMRRDGDYLVRIQPELLRGGRYTVTLTLEGSLAFPVSGRDPDAILSRYGAPRDGGRRDHHGVDIFAPRGTPALAAAEGTVSRVDTTSRGGRVVWLRARGGPALYYAHLDQPLVRRGQRVAPGDTVGLIGNTGNAISTPPHLHFGIYQRGPVDPWPFLYRPEAGPPPLPPSLEGLGSWGRVTVDGAALRSGPAAGSSARGELAGGAVVRLAGAGGSWYAVRLPDGTSGYVSRGAVSLASEPMGAERLAVAVPLRARPLEHGVLVDSITAGGEVAVLGRFDDYLLVRDGHGREGWLAERLLGGGAPAAGQR